MKNKKFLLIALLVSATIALTTIACSLGAMAASEANAAVSSEAAHWQPGSPKTAEVHITMETWGTKGNKGNVSPGTHVQVFYCWPDYVMITPHNPLQQEKNTYMWRRAFDQYDGTQGYDPCDATQP